MDQCNEIEDNLSINNTKKAYNITKELTSNKPRQSRPSSIQDKNGQCLAENTEIMSK